MEVISGACCDAAKAAIIARKGIEWTWKAFRDMGCRRPPGKSRAAVHKRATAIRRLQSGPIFRPPYDPASADSTLPPFRPYCRSDRFGRAARGLRPRPEAGGGAATEGNCCRAG